MKDTVNIGSGRRVTWAFVALSLGASVLTAICVVCYQDAGRKVCPTTLRVGNQTCKLVPENQHYYTVRTCGSGLGNTEVVSAPACNYRCSSFETNAFTSQLAGIEPTNTCVMPRCGSGCGSGSGSGSGAGTR